MKKTKKDDSIFDTYADEYDLMTDAVGRRRKRDRGVVADGARGSGIRAVQIAHVGRLVAVHALL